MKVSGEMKFEFQGISFCDTDVIDYEDFIPNGEYNPHNVRPWLFHDHGFVLCIVFSSSCDDAIDIAVDSGKFDRYLIDETDYSDYDIEGGSWSCNFLGNAGKPFDIESLSVIELPNPSYSWVAMFAEFIKEK